MNIVGYLSIPFFFFSRKRLNELAQGLGPYPADLETSQSFIDGKRVYAANNFLKTIYSVPGSIATPGAKKVIFTACHSGKLKPTFTSPNIISTRPENVLMSRWISQFFCNLNFSKNFTCPWGKLITVFTSPIAKSTSPGLSVTTFFARCNPSTQDSQNTNLGTRDFTGAFSSRPRSVSLRPTPQSISLPSPSLIPAKVTFISQCLASLRTQTYFWSSLLSTRKVTLIYFSVALREATTGNTSVSAG